MDRALLLTFAVVLAATPLLAADGKAAPRRPVLVELFTSQGCSSCPPADRVLSELAQAGDGVVALAFHVDYWDRLGWRDPFSSAAWSERQSRYAKTFRTGRIYTPQLVVAGRREGNGADRSRVAELLAASREDGAVPIQLAVARRADALVVEVAAALPPALPATSLDLLVAIVEDGHETPVKAGENDRRNLRNDRVVRRLDLVASGADGRLAGTLELPTADLDLDHLGVVAFLQDPATMAVYGVAEVRALPASE